MEISNAQWSSGIVRPSAKSIDFDGNLFRQYNSKVDPAFSTYYNNYFRTIRLRPIKLHFPIEVQGEKYTYTFVFILENASLARAKKTKRASLTPQK